MRNRTFTFTVGVGQNREATPGMHLNDVPILHIGFHSLLSYPQILIPNQKNCGNGTFCLNNILLTADSAQQRLEKLLNLDTLKAQQVTLKAMYSKQQSTQAATKC